MRIAIAALIGVMGAAAPAAAEKFDRQADKAVRISSPEAMTSLFWSLESSCKGLKSDFYRRQCEGVRADRLSKVVSRSYLVDGDGAIDVGDYDPKSKSVEVVVRACVSCTDEAERFVVGTGRHKMARGAMQAARLKVGNQSFKDDAHGEHWKKHVAPRLRTQFLVKLPRRVERFKAAGKRGYKVRIAGYRVFDPCKGEVLWSRPRSNEAPQDASTCKGEPAVVAAKPEKKPEKPEKPKGPELPERLTTAQINEALKPAMEQAEKCFKAYGVPGTASFRLTISGSGKLSKAEQTGDFKGTPTGMCVEKAVVATEFPKSKKKQMTVTYPVVLQ